LCENIQPQSCKAFTGISNRAATVGGEWSHPLVPEILGQGDPRPLKTATSNVYSLVARQADVVILTYYHVTADLSQSFEVNGSNVKVIECHDVLASKNRCIS